MNKERRVLELFKSDSNCRYNYLIIQDGFIYSTDGHSACRVKYNNQINKSELKESTLKMSHLFKYSKNTINIDIDSELLKSHKNVDELKFNASECSECSGYGEVEWEYGYHTQDFECPICNGSGEVESKIGRPTGEMTYSISKVDVIGKVFAPIQIERLLKAKDIIGGGITLHKDSKDNLQDMFVVGDFEIIIMPVYSIYNENIINIAKQI